MSLVKGVSMSKSNLQCKSNCKGVRKGKSNLQSKSKSKSKGKALRKQTAARPGKLDEGISNANAKQCKMSARKAMQSNATEKLVELSTSKRLATRRCKSNSKSNPLLTWAKSATTSTMSSLTSIGSLKKRETKTQGRNGGTNHLKSRDSASLRTLLELLPHRIQKVRLVAKRSPV